MVRSRYGSGAVEVRLWYGRGLEVRSWYGLGAVEVRSWCDSGSVRFVNFSTGNTVSMYACTYTHTYVYVYIEFFYA